MKKKALSLLLAVLLVFLSIPMTLLSAFAEGVTELAEALDNTTPKISITPKDIHEKTSLAKPDASGDVYFVIKADPVPTEKITVFYKTADLSALAQTGDYEAQDSSVELTPEAPEVTISIKTNKADYSTRNYFYSTYYGNVTYESYNARRFEVILTGVQGDARLDEKKSNALCALNGKHQLEAYHGSDRNYRLYALAPYTSMRDFVLKDFFFTPNGRLNGAYASSHGDNWMTFPADWGAYMDSGVDAKLYMSIDDAHIEESYINSDALLYVDIAGVATVFFYGEFHDKEEFGWGPAFSHYYCGENKNWTPSDAYKNSFEENFGRVDWDTHTNELRRVYVNDERKLNDKETLTLEECMNRGFVILRDSDSYWGQNRLYYGWPSNSWWISVPDDLYKTHNITLDLLSEGGDNRWFTRGDLVFRLEDITAPKIEKEGNALAVYNNLNTAKAGEKLRISVRFNEPVQLREGNAPYILGKINGLSGTLIEPDKNNIKFDYIGGSGTDTLYFEAEYSGNLQVSSIMDLTFGNAGSIADYGGKQNSFEGQTFSITNVNYDLRVPTVSVPNTNVQSTWTRSFDIPVTVGEISESAVLYYAWGDTKDVPEVFTNKISLNNITVNGTQTVSIIGDGNGTKYLHLKAVSRCGISSERILVVYNVSFATDYLGPYQFDNSPPTVDENTLLPIKDQSTTLKKVYLIDPPTDEHAGFADIKLYYIDENGTSVLLRTFDKASFTNFGGVATPQSIEITADEVGVGVNTRREVTLFYTITDTLGNIDEDAGRHTTVFDTNLYIDIEEAGSSQDFKTCTEVLDGGYTLLYSNDKHITVGSDTVYYTFELKIKQSNFGGEHIFSVLRNGSELTSGHNFTAEINVDTGIVTVHLNFTSELDEGYYDIQLLGYEDLADVGTRAPERVSEVYRVYVGTEQGKLGDKIESGTTLIGTVFQLPSAGGLYYMDTDVSFGNVNIEYYNPKKLPLSFSTAEKAREFVLFNEYKDLYAVTLTESLADALNAGSYSTQKDRLEDTEARAGQVWIRYKKSTWGYGDTDASSWVFYYYGTSEVIDLNSISKNLSFAISEVTDRIVGLGQNVSLTDFSLIDGSAKPTLVDKFGSPYLDPSQINAVDRLIVNERRASSFAGEVRYYADLSIYSSTVVIGGLEYTIAGNLVIPEGSRFQYKYLDESGNEPSLWTELLSTRGQRFSDALAVGGRYKIRELGAHGASEHVVYIDKEAPLLSVSWQDKDGTAHSQLISQSSVGEFRSRTFTIISIDARECDKYSYVAIYSIATSRLVNVYTMSELQKKTITLEDGSYYMVVSDRTGNHYKMNLYINSSVLDCEVTESENIKIKFSCQRTPEQIQEFYVKRNGVLVSGVYEGQLEFKESGTYEFFVRDIYGNVFSELYEFVRDYPKIDWRYRDPSGFYVAYDPAKRSPIFDVQEISDGSFKLSTSVALKFQLPSIYGYKFIGTAPEHDYSLTDGTVTIKSAQSFQLMIYYLGYESVYTIYNCAADTSSPSITVSSETDVSVPDEIAILKNAINDAINNGTIDSMGKVLVPPRISYSSSTTGVRYLSSGDSILSDFIRVSASDESGIASVVVYLNGEMIKSQSFETGITDIILSRSGNYRIVATDMLGNKSEFTFNNENPISFDYLVDGKLNDIGLHDYENFDQNGSYLVSNYGNGSVSFVIREKMTVFYMITDTDGARIFVAFEVAGGKVYEVYYTVSSTNSLELARAEHAVFDINNTEIAPTKDKVIFAPGDTLLKIFARADASGNIILTVYCEKNSAITVEARLSTEDEEFYYTKTELSSIDAGLVISSDGKDINTIDTNGQIRINKAFSIALSNFTDRNVRFIEVYYSIMNDLDETNLSGRDNIYKDGAVFAEQGFYLIKSQNKYGVVSYHRVHVSNSFDVTSYLELADGHKVHFSASYGKTLYSNAKIVFELHATDATVVVTKNGASFIPPISIVDGITYLTLTESGVYVITATDAHTNTVVRKAEIGKAQTPPSGDILTDLSPSAKGQESYTNKKHSLIEDAIQSEGIYYLAIRFGGEERVLLDLISETVTLLNDASVKDAIGSRGDGLYTLIMRDRYGTLVGRDINYRSAPTLTLQRTTRNSTEASPYDLFLAEKIGFWSNGALTFSTEAKNYVFTINGDKTECPKTLAFESSDKYGRSEYNITYTDEYGFSYSFKAYLVRQDIEVSRAPELTGIMVDDVFTTTDGISILFDSNASCTYTCDGSAERAYTLGTKLTKDGTYRFVVTDYSGNVASLTLKKDTTVEFGMFIAGTQSTILSGSVVNASKVDFRPLNGDSARIEKVLKDGVVQKDFADTRFAADGTWELILTDDLGNKAYFCFVIVSKNQNGFAYTTPYEYRISELWYDNGSGIKTSYMHFVNHSELTSSFEFSENGKYTAKMSSLLTGETYDFSFTVNTSAPDVSLTGCEVGETTINDVSLTGCKVGDIIRVYRDTDMGEELISETLVSTATTLMPIISEGGEYRIEVESEAGVITELSFVRRHVMNTAGSVFILIIIGVAVISLFAGLVYRNKSKTDG